MADRKYPALFLVAVTCVVGSALAGDVILPAESQEFLSQACGMKSPSHDQFSACWKSCCVDPYCERASLDKTDTCTRFRYDYDPAKATSLVDTKSVVKSYKKVSRDSSLVCKNGGRIHESGLFCVCNVTDGWVGKQCERRPYHCGEFLLYGYDRAGSFRAVLNPSGLTDRDFSGLCWFTSRIANTKVAVKLSKGNSFFTKSWDDYVAGFREVSEDIYSDLWFGLDNMYLLNSRHGLTSVHLNMGFRGGNAEKFYWTLRGFKMKDAAWNYSYTADTYWHSNVTGTFLQGVQSCLEPTQNVPFSTYDRDNDGDDSTNCAADHGNGWWFRGCDPSSTCNPLGHFFGYGDSGQDGPIEFQLPGIDANSVPPDVKLTIFQMVFF